jgi:hypothetical protein
MGARDWGLGYGKIRKEELGIRNNSKQEGVRRNR